MSYALASRRTSGLGLGCACTGMGEITLPETLLTPGDIIAAADRLNAAVQELTGDVTQHIDRLNLRTSADGQRFFNEWMPFTVQWAQFYGHIHRTDDPRMTPSGLLEWMRGSGDYIGGTFAAQLHAMADRYNQFERRYQTLTGLQPTGTEHSHVSLSEWFSRAGRTGMIWATIGIVGIGTLGYLLSQYAKVRMVSKVALNPRRRSRRQARGRR